LIDCAEWFLQVEKFSKDQILEEKLASVGGALGAAADDGTFYNEVASSAPAPGGGSVSASAGALAAALASMVCRLTVNKKKYAAVKEELSDIRDKGDELRAELTRLIDDDKEAFNAVMEAFKVTGDERDEAVEKANKHAAEVPLTVMKKALEAMEMTLVVAARGNENSISDAGVAGLMGHAAIEGAGYNVRINLGGINDQEFVARLSDEVAEIRKKGELLAADIKKSVEAKL
jgi:formiminotetrahydrofolate cyclodeaminase